MNIKDLRTLIRESLNEFNTNAAGGANQPIHAFTIPNQPPAVADTGEIPLTPEDLQVAIVAAIKNLVNPVGDADEEGHSARRIELDRSRRVLEYWVNGLGAHDALESAALAAGEEMMTSLNTSGISHSKNSGTLAHGGHYE